MLVSLALKYIPGLSTILR